MSKMSKKGIAEDDFHKFPAEMYFKIFAYLDLPSIRVSRCVSKRWKFLVDSVHNLSFICHLTDINTPIAINSSEIFPSLSISDFSGTQNKVVSATRGTGRLFASADSIEILGSHINSAEIRKMMLYAVKAVKELAFKDCPSYIIRSSLFLSRPFESLRKLTMTYKYFPTLADTRVLNNLARPQNTNELPTLVHFKVSYELDRIDDLVQDHHMPTSNDVLANYIAISKVIVGFKTSLKFVEILRNDVLRTSIVLHLNTNSVLVTQFQRHEIQECVNQLQNVQLEQLILTPLMDEGDFPWILETTLMKKQQSLQEISYDKKLSFPERGAQLLRLLLPTKVEQFTSVKIAITCAGMESIDLSVFSQCQNLKSLWLIIYRGVRVGPVRENLLAFSNLEQLPRHLTSLRFKGNQGDSITIHHQSILSKDQILWICNNLKDLQSLWLQLVSEERAEDVAPVRMNGEDVDDIEEDEDNQPFFRRLHENINLNVNIDSATFKRVTSLVKCKEYKFDMLKAGQLGAILEVGDDGNPWILPMRSVAREDFQEYIQICEQDPTILRFDPADVSFFPFSFIELSILKK